MRIDSLAFAPYEDYLAPKLWVQKLPSVWQRTLPDPSSYPATSTAFSLKFADDEKDAVRVMEEALGTEESIVTPELIVEGTRLGGYIGTYNVEGVTGENILLSPKKVPSDAVDVLAFHYTNEIVEDTETPSSQPEDEGEEIIDTDDIEDQGETIIDGDDPVDDEIGDDEPEIVTPGGIKSDTKSWIQIEDAHIENGFVYGTVESFSPIAVFYIKRAGYFASSAQAGHKQFDNVYICNGEYTIIKETKDGKYSVTNSVGETTEYDTITTVIGGTNDGSEIKKTNLIIDGFKTKAISVIGSSTAKDIDTTVKLPELNLTVKNCTKATLRIAYPNVKVGVSNVIVDNCKLSYIGSGESIWNGKDTNGPSDDALSLASPSCTNEFNLNISNSSVQIFYGGGITGRYYTAHSNVVADKCDLGPYVTAGGSNGKTGESVWKCTDGTLIQQFQTTNRGIVESFSGVFENCELGNFYVGGDPRESDVIGTINKVYVKAVGGTLNIGRGTLNGEPMTQDDVDRVVEKVLCTVSTDLNYITDEDKILNVLVSVRK